MDGPTVLRETSGGNPMFVRELLVGAADAGAPSNRDGMWIMRRPLPNPVPVGRRLGQLSEVVDGRLVSLFADPELPRRDRGPGWS